MKKNRPLRSLKNIGTKVAARLEEVGISDEAALRKTGPAKAYLSVKVNYPDETLPVCYYLYSLEGALRDKHWDDIPESKKNALLKAIGRD